MIRLEGVSRTYGAVRALRRVGFHLGAGSICGLLGANGAGKSTLFKILAGLVTPDAGSLLWDDRPMPFGHIELKRSLGYVPEEDLLDDYLTVTEFLEFVAAVRNVPGPDRNSRISRWIDFFELGDKRRTLLRECSHGMRRKVSLAAALLAEPRLLLLDEAMNGIDTASRLRLRDELRKYRTDGGTILFSSHVIETVEPLCDRVLILSSGRLVADVAASEWREPDGSGSLEDIFLRATVQASDFQDGTSHDHTDQGDYR
jgi:ABC-2 type transport system ATP-binding protein